MYSGFRSLELFPGALPLGSSTNSLPSSESYPSMLPFIIAYFEEFCGLVLLESENIALYLGKTPLPQTNGVVFTDGEGNASRQ